MRESNKPSKLKNSQKTLIVKQNNLSFYILEKIYLLKNKIKLEYILLVILFLISFSIRFYKVTEIPNGLFYDEVDAGYQARSILETGKSYRGNLSPFYVQSFLDPRTPIPIYFTTITTLIFKTPELQVRMPSVILGVAIVFLLFFLIKAWTDNIFIAFITGSVTAINPWQVQFSRFSQEATSTVFFMLISLLFFYKGLKTKKFISLIFSIIFLSLDVYTYRAMSFLVPLFCILIALVYKKELLQFGFKRLALIIVIPILMIVPFLYYTTIGAPDIPRINQISIFSDPLTPIKIQRSRELDSNDGTDHHIGKSAILSSFIFENKPLSWLGAFTKNYLNTFSTVFLFVRGDDNNLRHSTQENGYLYYTDIIALICGLFYIGKNLKNKHFQFLIGWLLITPIASSLTVDGAGHGVRLFTFSAPLIIIVGIGWWYFFTTLKNTKYKLLIPSVLMIWLILFIFYLHHYFVHYQVKSAPWFGYGFKQATADILKYQSRYKEIDMSISADPPILYFLFWSNTDPKLVAQYGSEYFSNTAKNLPLDKYKAVAMPSNILGSNTYLQYFRSDTLYLINEHEAGLGFTGTVPAGIILLDKIKFPDGTPNLYLITKDPNHNNP